MKITKSLIEDELIGYFNPFAHIAVQNGESEGGFDIIKSGEEELEFIIFDKLFQDETKQKIWSKKINVSKYKDVLSLKTGISGDLEISILEFCEQ